MTVRVAIMGAPCTGKSTMAAELFSRIKKKGVHASLALEFVRDGFNNGLEVQSASHQLLVYNKQLEREESQERTSDVVISDSPLFLTYFYGLTNLQNTQTDRMALQDLYQKFLNNINRYDIVVMLKRPEYCSYAADDGVRQQTKEEAYRVQGELEMLMDLHKIPYTVHWDYTDGLEFLTDEVLKCVA